MKTNFCDNYWVKKAEELGLETAESARALFNNREGESVDMVPLDIAIQAVKIAEQNIKENYGKKSSDFRNRWTGRLSKRNRRRL